MRKSLVALVRCSTYAEESVSAAVESAVDRIGGISSFARPGEKIVLKPNVLVGTNPDKCVSTHPSVFSAVGRLLQHAGAAVSYGDSPSFGSTEGHLRRAGLSRAADGLGISLADFTKGTNVSHGDALLIKSFVVANGVLESDGVVSLPKLKTHPLTRITGAIKNQFGCIPGLLKSQYHVKLPDAYDFATMLVDLNTLIRPRLYVMDAVMAMEGNGPRSGRPRRLGLILASDDPIALDSVASRIINLDPEYVPTSRPGEESGLGTYHAENIEIVGERVDDLVQTDFDVIRQPPEHSTGGRILRFIKNRITARPAIDRERCTCCGTCVTMCPVEPKAVDWHAADDSEPPRHQYGRCIRCYCCQENCPEGAIHVENPLLGRVFFRA